MKDEINIDKLFAESKAAGVLPSPTGVALAVLELSQQEDSSARDIANVLRADPALSGRLLKFANSPYVGFSRAIASIEDAVVLLGIHVIRHLTLGLSVISNTKNGKCENFDYAEFWSRSLAKGIAAQILCTTDKPFPPEEAFVCGLLSRVGSLALASIYPDTYSKIIAAVGEEGTLTLKTLEQQNLSIDHVELSAALMQDWGLPEVQLLAVRHYETLDQSNLPPKSREFLLAKILQTASYIAKMCICDDGPRATLVPQLIALSEGLELSQADIHELIDEVVEQWSEWSKLLEVPNRPVPPFATLLEKVRDAEQRKNEPEKNGLRILVVDDDPSTVRLLARQLGEQGHYVVTASDGREGLRLALDTKPQIVVTDWMMPQMDGIGLCKALREARLGQLLYIIMLTVQENENNLVTAFEAGADDYIVKPFSRKVLEARIRGGERLIRLQDEVAEEQDENRRHIAELALMNRRLQESAMTDLLTELPNRRYALEYLEKEWATVQRSGQSLACLMIDVDHFKKFNDRYGHEIGDNVLVQTAAILRSTARASDLVCRFGGEEFIVVCANTATVAAENLAERLRKAVESQKFTKDKLSVTISVGIAVRNTLMTEEKELIRSADGALMNAKRSGRNRVCLWIEN